MSFNFQRFLSEAVFGGLGQILHMLPAVLHVLTYVLTAFGLYTIAKRREIQNPWLAWIPIANIWILGSVSDQYRYVTRGQVRSRRKLLLTLQIVSAAVSCILVFVIIGLTVQMVMDGVSSGFLLEKLMTLILKFVFVGLLELPFAIALAVFRYMAVYDLYMSCSPDNAVLFLVLGIFFRFLEPFFIFFSREKEQGMPPRKQASAPRYQVPQYQPPQPRSGSTPEVQPAAPSMQTGTPGEAPEDPEHL